MTNTAYPPKLQFAPDTAVTVAFPFGDFKLIDSKTEGWDPSFMYATTVAATPSSRRRGCTPPCRNLALEPKAPWRSPR